MSIIDNTRPETQTAAGATALFPPDFLWGAASSSYQVEGATQEDGRAPSIWDYFAALPGKTYQGQSGEIADDHYHRMPEDVALMAAMGLGAYRFSLAWPRILPQGTGKINEKGLDFYDRLVDTLLSHNITPLATLYHWDLPLALHEQGGWLKRDTAYAFADYAEVVAKRLGDRVTWWTTHNEPWCSSYLGYGSGVHAPGIQDKQLAVIAAHHVLLSHGLAVPVIRAQTRPDAQVGISLDFSPFYAADDSAETQEAVRRADNTRNRWFIDPIYRGSYSDRLFADMQAAPPPIQPNDLAIISVPIDFLGVNYYTRIMVRGQAHIHEPDAIYTDMGWEIYPDGLHDLLIRLHREYAPKTMLITENGAAFNDTWDGNGSIADPQRTRYLETHIQAVARAIADGAPVHGYFTWSFMDNYEWAEGYSKRFGLVYVDYPTQRRIIKDSGKWYSSFLASFK
jgi:beta-glucosidase